MKKKIKSLLREYFYCKFCQRNQNLDTCWDCIVNERALYKFNTKYSYLRWVIFKLQNIFRLESLIQQEDNNNA